MGKIFDAFGSLKYRNEAEVIHWFLMPFLTEFLGYAHTEIIPELQIPAFSIPQNRKKSISSKDLPPKAKPDFVATLNGLQNMAFLCDAKGPKEKLEKYNKQLKAYCIAIGINPLLITNGKQLRIFNANDLIFQSEDIADLDLKFPTLYTLLGRENTAKFSAIERIQRVDLTIALSSNQNKVFHTQLNTEYVQYVRQITEESSGLEIPLPIIEALSLDVKRFPASDLYIFKNHPEFFGRNSDEHNIVYDTLLKDENLTAPLLIIGESGIGKTQLTQQLLFDRSHSFLNQTTTTIPVLLKLGNYTSKRELLELIRENFISRGLKNTEDKFIELLREGRLLLILDAFDEIIDDYVSDCVRDIKSLLENYPKTKLIVTTREYKLPNIVSFRRYQIQPINLDTIEKFSEFYLPDQHSDFLHEIKQKHLVRVASNTLLLTLLIFLYSEEHKLPRSRGQILKKIVDLVRIYNEKKGQGLTQPISWDARVKLLSKLAYHTNVRGAGYELDDSSVNTVLLAELGVLENERLIRTGLTIDQALESLEETGVISRTNNGIVFWHRAFMEHFASYEIAQEISTQPETLSELVEQSGWESILPISISKAHAYENLIDKILALNIFTAARTILECETVNEVLQQQTIKALSNKCQSSQYAIRQISLGLLLQFDGDIANQALHGLLAPNIPTDIQTTVFLEIVQRRLPNARELVFNRLDWNVRSPLNFSYGARETVIQALAMFDDEEAHIQIVSMWRKNTFMYMNFACQDAFLSIIKRSRVSDFVVDELLDMFLDTTSNNKMALAAIFIALRDLRVAKKLIAVAKTLVEDKSERAFMRFSVYDLERILGAYIDRAVIQEIIDNALDVNLNTYNREIFAHALTECKGEIPLSVFKALSLDNNYQIQHYGIVGLARFDFDEVESIVLQALRISVNAKSAKSIKMDYANVQNAVFKTLAHLGKLELLLEPENMPKVMYSNSWETLCAEMRKQKLTSMLPFLDSYKWPLESPRVEAAWTFAELGEISKAQKIIKQIFQTPAEKRKQSEPRIDIQIIEGIHRLPEDFAYEIIDNKLSQIDDERVFGISECIDSLVKIGTSKARERLLNLAWSLVAKKSMDTTFALLALLAFEGPDMEDWAVKLLATFPDIDGIELLRTLQILGISGSRKVLPLLEPYLANEPNIQQTAFWAIQEIHKRNGQVWYNDEEKYYLN